MPYYTRVFCTDALIPSLDAAILHANNQSLQFDLTIDLETFDKYSNGSMSFELKYKIEMQPIVVEINMVDDVDAVGKEEIKEFITDIGFAGFSSIKRKVINHLEKTKFIVVCQLLSDINDDGYKANDSFLDFFVKNCGGLLHLDAEGFYDGDMNILLPDK